MLLIDASESIFIYCKFFALFQFFLNTPKLENILGRACPLDNIAVLSTLGAVHMAQVVKRILLVHRETLVSLVVNNHLKR